MRISDWSSDVCSSDLLLSLLADAHAVLDLAQSNPELSLHQIGKREGRCRTHLARLLRIAWLSPRIVEAIVDGSQPQNCNRQQIGRASCRERVCQYVSISVVAGS